MTDDRPPMPCFLAKPQGGDFDRHRRTVLAELLEGKALGVRATEILEILRPRRGRHLLSENLTQPCFRVALIVMKDIEQFGTWRDKIETDLEQARLRSVGTRVVRTAIAAFAEAPTAFAHPQAEKQH